MEVKKDLEIKDMYHFLETYCEKKHYENALVALPFAREVHKEQKRLGGDPYIVHPLSVAFFSIGAGLDSDNIISGSLLHDTIEDQNANLDLINITDEIKHIVNLLTFIKKANLSKDIALKNYYENIKTNCDAIIIKLIDRIHNLSTMNNAFSLEKMKNYIIETQNYVIPLADYAKDHYQNIANKLWLLKFYLTTLVNTTNYVINEEEKLVRKIS